MGHSKMSYIVEMLSNCYRVGAVAKISYRHSSYDLLCLLGGITKIFWLFPRVGVPCS